MEVISMHVVTPRQTRSPHSQKLWCHKSEQEPTIQKTTGQEDSPSSTSKSLGFSRRTLAAQIIVECQVEVIRIAEEAAKNEGSAK